MTTSPFRFRRVVCALLAALLASNSVLAATYQYNAHVKGFVGPHPGTAGQGEIDPGDNGSEDPGSGGSGGSGNTGGTGGGGTGGSGETGGGTGGGTGSPGDETGTGGTGGTEDTDVRDPAYASTSNLVFSPGSLKFGAHLAGESTSLTATLLNTGGLSAEGISINAPSGNYSVTGNTCGSTLASGASCAITVQFTAGDTGTFAQTMSADTPVTSADLQLSASVPSAGAAKLTFAPAGLAFGNSPVGATVVKSTAVKNVGTQPASITGISVVNGTSDFAQSNDCGGSLAVNASCTVNVGFTATAENSRSGTLTVMGNDLAPVSIALTGTGAHADLAVSPSTLSFGTVAAGTTTTKTATLSNKGSVASAVAVPSVTADSGFALTSTSCGAEVPAGGSCQATVSFTAPAADYVSKKGLLSFNVAGATYSAALSGATRAPVLTVDPASVNFGSSNVGTPSNIITVTVTNPSDAPAYVTNVDVVTGRGSFRSSNNCGDTLVGHGSCAVNVWMVPGAHGALLGTLAVVSASGVKSVALSGSGVGPSAALDDMGTPTVDELGYPHYTVTFPNTYIDSTSAVRIVKYRNVGDGDLTGISVATPSADFSLDNACAGVTLAPGAFCNLTFTFNPRASGAMVSTVALQSASGLIYLDLKGKGLAPLTLTPSANSVDQVAASGIYADTLVGSTRNKTFYLLKSGSGIASASFSLDNTNDFAITSVQRYYADYQAGYGFSVMNTACGSASSCTADGTYQNLYVTVRFNSADESVKSGNLTVTYNGGRTLTIPLNAKGIYQPKLSLAASGLSGSTWTLPSYGINSTNPAKQVLTVTNSGTGLLTLSTALAGSGASAYAVTGCEAGVPAGGTCQLQVTSTPKAATNPATLTITSNATDSPTKVLTMATTGLTYLGLLAPAGTTTAVGTVDFAQVLTTAPVTKDFEFTSKGTGTLTGVAATVTGTDLTLSANTCGTPASPITLAANAKCTMSVRYAPTAAGTLESTAALTVVSNATTAVPAIKFTGSAIIDWWSQTLLALQFNTASLGFNGKGAAFAVGGPSVSGNSNALLLGSDTFGASSTSNSLVGTMPALSGDFTIELRMNRVIKEKTYSSTVFESRNSNGDSGGFQLMVDDLSTTGNDTRLGFQFAGGNPSYITNSFTKFALNTWYHIAIVRKAGVYTLFVNGTSAGSFGSDSSNYAAHALTIGAGRYLRSTPSNYRQFAGYLDEFLVTSGAKYTANFTPNMSGSIGP